MAPKVAFPHILFLSFLLFPLFAVSQSNVTFVTLGTSLTAGEGSQWTSPSGDFAFGFHSLQDDFFLLCIWYNNIPVPDQTIVWSANGDNPAPRNSRIELTTAGQLVLTNPQGQALWKTQIGFSNVAYGAMLDNGNFVLESNNFYHVWESFSQPTDTILPGQTLQVGGKLYCRLTDTNYTRGRFELQLLAGTLQLNPVAVPTYFAYDPYFTIRAYLDEPFSQLVFNELGYLYLQRSDGTISNVFQVPFADYYYRATLDIHGAFSVYKHPRSTSGTSEGWTIDVSFPDNICEVLVDLGSGPCGYNSYCEFANGTVNCSCPPEYVPIDQNSTISGCKPKIPLVCEEDQSPEDLYEFSELIDTDWPLDDYERFHPIGEEDCKTSCLYDCYCAVVIYGLNETCWKKKLPLSNGKSSSTVARIAYFKLRRPSNSTTNTTSNSTTTTRSNSTTTTTSNSTTKKKDQTVAILAASLSASVSINFLLLAATCLTAFFGYRRISKGKQVSDLSGTNLRSVTREELEEA